MTARMESDKPHEECAVFGVSVRSDEAAGITYNGLLSLQHRGQESAGIAAIKDKKILYHKDVGLVSEVFTTKILERLPASHTAVGHTRYSTTGGNTKENAGPFITEFLTGRIAVAHNGNVTNAREIKEKLKAEGLNFNSTSDSEVVSSLIAFYIMNEGDTLSGVIRAAAQIKGAFSLIVLCGDEKLIVIRDSNGYRPLCIGKNGFGIAAASESCALDSCGFELIRDIIPGEVVVIEKGEITYSEVVLKEKDENCGLCIFEYVYFSRADSMLDGLSVYEARFNMGVRLAEEYPVDADIVCGVPDSGLEAAIGYSRQSGIPLVSGFVKNRYIGRSFIYPSQSQRESAVRLKLNPLSSNVKGKRIVLIDDSIVRGTTSEKIVRSLKHAGASEVHMRISSPPFCYTCHYGTDIDNEENLIANKLTIENMAKQIGADSLGFISIDGLKKACTRCKVPFCTNCFTGNHRSEEITKNELE